MATYCLWENTNKEHFTAILFSMMLTPFSLFFDIVCPFMLVGNILLLGYIIFEIINKRKTLKEILEEIFSEGE